MLKVDHSKNIIEIQNISFSYDGMNNVLEKITFNIHPGDYIGLVGPNGAGKTTLLKIILGLLKPNDGMIKIFGVNLQDFKDWKKIGYVPQKTVNFDSNFPASVFEVVLMGRYSNENLFQRTTKKDSEAVEEALKKVEMWDYRDRLIGDLSGGQQQRVFIARALVNNPLVIFLDEPTSGVDAQTQDSFYELLQKLNKKLGITLVLVSHDVERLVREVMHIACIDKTLTCHLSPEEYLKESESEKIHGKSFKIITHHHHT